MATTEAFIMCVTQVWHMQGQEQELRETDTGKPISLRTQNKMDSKYTAIYFLKQQSDFSV